MAKRLPYCKMTRMGDKFSIVLRVPAGSRLDYCFNVLIPSKKINTWDTNGGTGKDYRQFGWHAPSTYLYFPDPSAFIIQIEL